MDHPATEPAVADAEAPAISDELGDAAPAETEDTLYPDDQSEDTEGDDLPDDEPDADEPRPIIDAPGLKAEEKDRFAKLPREDQEFVASVLQRRHIEAKTGIEQERAAKRAVETQAAQQLSETQRAFADQTASLIAAFAPQPPPIELLRQNPDEYHYLKAVYDQEIAGFGNVLTQIDALRQQDAQQTQQRDEVDRIERLKGWLTVPEVANEETRIAFLGEIEAHGTELGFEKDALETMDAREMVALKRSLGFKKEADANRADAEKWRAYKRQRNERPRAAQGRFATAPAGARTGGQARQNDTLKALYPND